MQPDTSSPFQNIPLDKIEPSRTNPRKRFPEDKMQELAANIKAHGVLQPILVRPVDKSGRAVINDDTLDHYEIVAGERRFRASKLAEQASIPAIVRELTDIDALELQIHENLHREDLHPIEEAEGFQYLLDKSNPLTGLTVEQLCEKVGKSRSYVFASLKLLNLCPYGRDVCYEGKVGKEIAQLVGRIPGAKLQTHALKEIMNYNGGQGMSFRTAQAHLRSRYTLDLEDAQFDRHSTTLCPEAGSCFSCPKRSGNEPELFSDIESPDVCTDPDCFAAKKAAHVIYLQQSGKPVITGEDAEKIIPYGVNAYVTGGYARPDSYANGTGMHGKWGDILGDDLPDPVVVIDKNNNAIELYEESALKQKLQEKIDAGELKVEPREVSEEEKKRAAQREAQQAAKAQEHARRLYHLTTLATALEDPARRDPDYALKMMISYLYETQLGTDSIAELNNVYNHHDPETDIVRLAIEKPGAGIDAYKLAMLMLAIGGVQPDYWFESTEENGDDEEYQLFAKICKDFGIDADAPLLEPEPAPTPPTAAQAQETTAQETDDENPEGQTGHSKDPEVPLVPIEKAAETAAQVDDSNLPPGFQKAKAKALAKKAKAENQKVPAKAGGAKKASAAAAAEETKGATV